MTEQLVKPVRDVAVVLFFGVFCTTSFSVAADDDLVVYLGGRDGKLQQKRTGTIVDYRGTELTLRQQSGRELTIESDRVVRVQTTYTRQHVEAEKEFAANQWRKALTLFRQARQTEKRRWVLRQIIAREVLCLRYLGNLDQAADEFLLIVRSDPSTFHFDSIPLVWSSARLTSASQQRAAAWVADRENAVAALIGASWLLGSSDSSATEALRRLASDADPRIAFLAQAQQWRAKLVTATPDEIAKWEDAIRRMPDKIRAGPYYLVGRALAQQKEHERAALALLRVPILYPQNRALSVASLMTAARSLEAIDQRKESIVLYRELLDGFPEADRRDEIEQRLENLNES